MSRPRPAACVMGWPVKHSRAPIIHGHWIEKHGIDADFRLEAVPAEEFPAFLATLADRGYVGGTATMPHKEMALKLTEPDDRARAIGAANAMWFENGRLRSTNSDSIGFIAALDEASPGWRDRAGKAVVFGAGGAARAIVWALLDRGVERVHVVNRTRDKADALRARFGAGVVPTAWDDRAGALAGAGLVANASSLGMVGYPPLDVDLTSVAADALIADAVYVPLDTPLLEQARRRGLAVSDGLAMLLHQASGCFEKWFGVTPVVTPDLRAKVEAALKPA